MNVKERIELFKQHLPFLNDKVAYLQENNFFTAPASTKHHGAYEGGLFDHSLEVTKTLVELTEKNNLKWERKESPLIIGMFHDLCKMDNYMSNSRIIAHRMDGTPITFSEGYTYNNDTLYKGHGDKSVMLLAQFMQLTSEEVACIRYHMGAFTDKSEWEYYTRIIKLYENVLWTHHADMIASQIKEI